MRVWLPFLVPIVSGLAVMGYARQQGIPYDLASTARWAFLIEALFYVALGQHNIRQRWRDIPYTALAGGLAVSSVIPYLIATLTLGGFDWTNFATLAGLAALLSFWYVFLAPRWSSDIGFLVLMVVGVLTGIVRQQYPSIHPKLPLSELGHVMWFRTGMASILLIRRADDLKFGFWPTREEWIVGARFFLFFLPLAAAVAWAIGFGRPHIPTVSADRIALQAVGTFLGFLWVVGLAEEFFFRGLLQSWVTDWSGNARFALGAVSIAFGSVHLWFKEFPNWRFAIMATLAGVFYGLAFQKTKSVRASTVTHALTVTIWRLFVA